MAKGVYAALSGAVASGVALETTAQNLANASTTGYHRLRPVFREVLARSAEAPQPAVGKTQPSENRLAVVASTVIDMTPGVTRSTGNPLDVVFPEGTFAAISTDRGERYTRAGNMRVGADGSIQLAGGKLASEDGQPINVDPAAQVSITKEGQVLADGEEVARIKLVEFQDPTRLQPEGAALLAASQASGAPEITSGELAIGELEEPNATPVTAMTELMTVSRLFDAYQRAIETFRDADRRIVQVPSS